MKNFFKAFICVVMSMLLMLSAVACSNDSGGENSLPDNYTRPTDVNIDNTFTATSNILVAYFSKTNTTRGVAETIRELTDADIFEIERKEPYPEAYTPTTEVAQEEKEANARPELAVYLPNDVMTQYDTIILGFPIWWHTAPMAVLSFLNYYDVSGKTIYTFCTAATSPITESTVDVRNNASGATVIEGKRFSNGNDSDIESWLDGLRLLASTNHPENPEQPENPELPEQPEESPDEPSSSNVLVAYFSATGSTERVAGYIADATGGDLFELVPVNQYTSADLSWTTPGSRVNREHDDESLRDIELISYTVENWATYDTVFIGYPIWWGIAAWPVNNFVTKNDFTGKTVIPFCTSSSSGLGQSGTLLEEMAKTGNWQSGQRFSSGASQSTVQSWLQSLGSLV